MSDRFEADVVFVGSGVAAGLAAARLARAGAKVLVLEAGPRIDRGAALETYWASPDKGENAPYPLQSYAPQPMLNDIGGYYVQKGPVPFRTLQTRVVGGTTWHWGGFAARYTPNDFRMASAYGLAVDWPIGYGDLEAWYTVAESEIGVAGADFVDFGGFRSAPYPMPAIPTTLVDSALATAAAALGLTVRTMPQGRNSVARDGRPQCCGNAMCVPLCPIQAKYDGSVHIGEAEAAGARIEPRSVVDRLVVAPDRTIEKVTFLRPDGSRHEAVGRVYVVACHVIETPKLLLMSAGENVPAGVANGSGEVGRNLMSLIDVGVQGLTPEPVYPYRGPVGTSYLMDYRDGPFRAGYAAFGLSPENTGWNRGTGPLKVAASLIAGGVTGDRIRFGIFHQISREMLIGSSVNMLPDPSNRIVPSADARDALGLPRPEITFNYDDYTRRGFEEARKVQDALARRMGLTEMTELGPIPDSAVMAGTCRMGSDPRTSVVDADLRSHDHPNLYISGSSTFPTSSVFPPTLTIAALSARLGEHLKTVLPSLPH